MKEITIDVLKDAANRLLFEMSEEEYQTLYEEFQTLVKQMNLIGDIPGVDASIPMTFPFPVFAESLREDIPQAPLSQEDALKNAKVVADGQIKLPKVVG